MAGLLGLACASGGDRMEAQLLPGKVLEQTSIWLIDKGLANERLDKGSCLLQQMVVRARGVPLAYLLGEREFHGLTLQVTPDVLVPRPDTEVLVDWALELLAERDAGYGAEAGASDPPTVADLGTGSGAIALALKHAHTRAQVCAVERSAAALTVARANGQRLGLPVEWLQGDWFAPLADRRFDLIVSNPPYIDGADAHLAALHAEPIAALTPGTDGLAALRVLARGAPSHLQPGGWLLLEHGHDQGAAVRSLLQAAGLEQVQTRRDLGGQERCTAGRCGPA